MAAIGVAIAAVAILLFCLRPQSSAAIAASSPDSDPNVVETDLGTVNEAEEALAVDSAVKSAGNARTAVQRMYAASDRLSAAYHSDPRSESAALSDLDVAQQAVVRFGDASVQELDDTISTSSRGHRSTAIAALVRIGGSSAAAVIAQVDFSTLAQSELEAIVNMTDGLPNGEAIELLQRAQRYLAGPSKEAANHRLERLAK